MTLVPTEEELRDRISRHLAARQSASEVVITWRGYLAGLSEWGLIDHHIHSRLVNLLPRESGIEEVSEIMLGPDYKEVQRQLTEEDERRRGG